MGATTLCRGAPRGRPLCSTRILVPGNAPPQQIARICHRSLTLGGEATGDMTVLQVMQCTCSAGVVARAVPTTSEGRQARPLL